MDRSKVIGERIIPEEFRVAKKQYLLYLRHVFAYRTAAGMLPPEGRVIEVGCGGGYGTHLLSGRVREIVGLDIDRRAIAYVSHRYGSENCRFLAYDGVTLPFEEAGFDAAISFQVIEHVEDDRRYVAELCRMLRPGGILLLTTPNKTHRLRPGQRPWNRYHKREYYPQELAEVLGTSFGQVEIWAVRSSPEIERPEKAGAGRSSALVSLLRRATPEWVKLAALRARGLVKREDFLQRYSLEDFYLDREYPAEGLDLMALARKS